MENIKLLREKSGAGMVDCKAALDEAGGDLEKALVILRKKGIAKAAKRTDREANEGIVKVAVDSAGQKGYILEVNAETDFVTRSERFLNFAEEVFSVAMRSADNLEELVSAKMADGNSVRDNLDNLSGVIGEKLSIKRYAVLSAPSVAAYSHAGGKLGVIAGLDSAGNDDLAYDIAMQAAAGNPLYAYPEDVPEEVVEKEKEIYREQLKKEGKDGQMVEKILAGKLNKFYEEVCLAKQEYIKDEKKKVQDILGTVKIKGFIRFGM
jgi:elongation factor Ts